MSKHDKFTGDVPAKNSALNNTIADVIGNKTDDVLGTSLMSMLYVLQRFNVSQSRIYPTLADEVTITKVNADAWGLDALPTEIIPVDTIAKPFSIFFINFGTISAVDQYELILYRGLGGAEIEIARVSFDRLGLQAQESSTPVTTEIIPANTRISAKLTAKAALSESVAIKLHYHEY